MAEVSESKYVNKQSESNQDLNNGTKFYHLMLCPKGALLGSLGMSLILALSVYEFAFSSKGLYT